MGSLEEEELVQMVRDFIESEPHTPISHTSSEPISLIQKSRYLTLQEIVWRITEAEVEILEKVSFCLMNIGTNAGDEPINLNKWVVTILQMDGFEASLCKTSSILKMDGYDEASLCKTSCDYEYIDVMVKDGKSSKPKRVIVDIDFKSQFELARPTQVYKELTSLLPHIFVGNEEKLKEIITLLSTSAKESMKKKGLHIPPWRKESYLQSKWFSEDCKKVSFLSSSSKEVGSDNINCCSNNFGKWVPPVVKPKKRNLGGSSALSSQFSKLGINCC